MKILAVAAHPDDLDFGCAGSTARWTAEGHEVVYCLVTSGEAGGEDPSISRPEMAELRKREQTEAAKVVGVTELHFLGFPDGSVEPTLELRKAIARIIRIVRPERVVSQSPERNYDRVYGSHPDHLAVGEATFNAVYPDSRNRFAFPELLEEEGLEPHTVEELWLIGGPDPNRHVDVTDTLQAKVEALLCHRSQIADPERMTEMMGNWGREQGRQAGLDEDRCAERFRVIKTV
ncbi:MAG: PIG-L deacetylase family protein [Actinomycetota bacterium]